MRVYLLSLGAGVLVGIIYSLIGVRSPAPPAVALIGLLGILVGEQIVPVVRQVLTGTAISAAWSRAGCGDHLFGLLPGHRDRSVIVATIQEKRP